MSKKSKHNVLTERPLAERIAKARQEGRTQQALDLSRQLYKQQRIPANEELLRQVTLERGQQLQSQGMFKDAATVYTHALTLGGSTEYQITVAERLAACGATTQALAVRTQIADPAVQQRILAHAVDAAIAKGKAGKAELPPELHAPFDLILQAFADSEAGRDDAARAALQGIGLQSPFLEWRVFLRGLLAYYVDDDTRALENWQRLDAQRMPARLAAPLRLKIDTAYRQAQPQTTQAVLARQADRLRGPSGAAEMLHSLRLDLPREKLAQAFRKGEQAVAALQRECPAVIPRLANCFAWAIIDHGEPDDLERFKRVFGAPPDDPRLHRLEGLALEARGLSTEAHVAWQNFIAEVANSPEHWPGETGKRVQAMIWARMAENARLTSRRKKSARTFFDFFEGPPKNLTPGAEACYQKAIELAPDRLESHRDLFEFLRHSGEEAKAKKAGQQLLDRFPNHADTLEAMGELFLDSDDYKKAQEYFEKSLQANPLDRDLRSKLARARRRFGLQLTIQKKFAPAREQYEQAMKLWDGSKASLLCQWASAELKANDQARAEELIAKAEAEPDHRLACRYAMVCEAARAKLLPKQKKQIAEALKTALAQAPTPAEILVLLESAAQQRDTHGETFRGQKTHEKTILKFLDDLSFGKFNEPQLERLCAGLQALQSRRPWLNCLEASRRRHPKNPYFRLSFADYYLTGPNPEEKTHQAGMHLEAARGLVEHLPRGEQQQQLMEQLQAKEKLIAQMGGRRGMFGILENIFGDADEDDDGPWDDDGDGFF